MQGISKVEEYLIDLGISYQEISKGAWLVEDEAKGLPKMVVSFIEPIVFIRAEVMPVPAERKEEFFEKLLRLNGTDFLHGAYALDGNQVIAIDTIEYEHMSRNEFGAAIEAMGFTLGQHYRTLTEFAASKEEK